MPIKVYSDEMITHSSADWERVAKRLNSELTAERAKVKMLREALVSAHGVLSGNDMSKRGLEISLQKTIAALKLTEN